MIERLYLPAQQDAAGLLALPPAGPATGLIVSVHGISRNAAEHAAALSWAAGRRGWATLAPIFRPERYPAYQRLCRRDGAGRADLALDALVELTLRRLELPPTEPFFLAGFSGGAQFAHRYALLNPGRVQALGLASAGWYTRLDHSLPFPHGLRPTRRLQFQPVRLEAFLRLPILVAVGEWDGHRDAALRQDAEIDAVQGRTRIERARCWLESVERASVDRGICAERQFLMLKRCGHDFLKAASRKRGDLAEIWAEFFWRHRGENSQRLSA